MKKIYSLILVAASLAVAACQPKELDDIVPDVKPDVKSVKITATIEDIDATKVDYAFLNDNSIKPTWAKNDELFGFDADGGKFTYVVTAVDETTGEATIEPKQGTSYTPAEGTLVYGIYYPGKDTTDIKDGSLAIDLAGQDGTLSGTSPAIMCATATVTGGEVRFHFENQTAIIGLKKIQVGTAETLQAGTTVNQIAIEGVVTHGKLSVDGGEIKLTPGTKASTVYAVPNPTPESWVTDDNGQIDFGAEDPVAFAVLPSTHVPTVYAYTATAAFKNGTPMSTKEMVAGNYYYMSKKLDASAEPVASLTVVGGVTSKYYSVSDAFDAADCSNADCTVKLLADCATTRTPNIRSSHGTGDITIDLNGKTLTMTQQFGVYDTNITICDNSSVELGSQGKITSDAAYPAFYFSGSSLTLAGGTLENTANSQYALYLTGTSNATISGGCVKSTNYRGIYQGSGCDLTMTGGKVEAHGNAIVCNAGRTGETNLDIKGDAIVSSDSTALYVSAGVVSVSGDAKIASDYRYSLYVISGSAAISDNCSFENEGYVLYTNKAQNVDAPTVNIDGGYFSNVKEGWTSTYSPIYAAYGTINISAGHFTANGVNPLGASSNGAINATGGYYNKAINSARLGDTYCNIASSEQGYDFQVNEAPAVASVEASNYTFKHGSLEGVARQLSERKDNASVSPVVTMLTDVTGLESTFTPVAKAGESVTLNLDGHVISAESLSPVVSTSSDLTISDSGNGEIITSGATALEVTAGETTVSSGSLFGATNAASVTGGTLKIYNGHFYGGNSSDIANDGGSVEVSGGWFRNTPASFVAGDYEPVSGTERFNDRDYYYTVAASQTIATVNNVNYGSLAAAIAAANAYSEVAEFVTIKIVSEANELTHNEAIDLNNISGKPIVFDLNGHTLSTSTAQFITSTGTSLVTITDSGETKGKITSTEYQIICAETVGSTITIDGCVIESDAEASTTGANAVVYVKRSAGSGTPYPAVVVDNGAKIYSKNQQPAMYASYGKITLNDCEVTSGADGEGAVYGVFQTSYGTVIVNSGASIYSKYTSGTKYGAVHSGSQYGTVTINGGHISGGYCVTGSSSAKGNVITINGGYFNTAFNLSGQNLSSAIFNGVVASSSEEYDHETTGEKLSYGYSIVKAAKIVELDKEYITLAEAVSAANSNTEAESLTIKLLGNHPKDSTVAPFLLNRGTKKVILDLNGCTLRGADSCFIKSSAGAVDIIDSNADKGMITSSAENVIVKSGGTGVLTIDGCTIVSTRVPNSTYNNDAVVYQYATNSVVNIKNSVIYSTKALTTLINKTGTMNIENSEISSGTESAGLITLFTGGSNASANITGGCFYNTTTTSGRGLFYIGVSGSAGTITVNSGYFYGTQFGRAYTTSSQFANIKLKGGYFNLLPKSESGAYYPSIESGYELKTDASGSYEHSIVGPLTDFTYQVVSSAGEASVEASTSTPVVSLGEARNGGVNF